DLIDFSKTVPHTSFQVQIEKEGNYDSIVMWLGVDATMDASDPNMYPIEHPLSGAHGTYWDMNSYRYMMFDGQLTTTDSVGLTRGISVHPGFNKNYRKISFARSTNLEFGKEYTFNFNLDVYQLLFNSSSPTDFKKSSVAHSD